MTKRNRLTIEQKLELAAEHKKGVSPKVLSERYGVSLRQVDAIVQRERAGTFAKLSPSKHYTFRAPEGDVEAYLDLAASLGIAGSSNAFRALIRLSLGLVEVFPVDLDGFNAMVVSANRQKTLLNQIAKRVNKGQVRLTDEDREVFEALLENTASLQKEWKAVLDDAVSRRGYTVSKLKDLQANAK